MIGREKEIIPGGLMCPLCITLSLCVVTLALLYDSSPGELLHVPIKFLTVECTGIKILIVVKVVIGVVKPYRAWSGRSIVAVGGA